MNGLRFQLRRFWGLLRREALENIALFFGAPAVLTLIILALAVWGSVRIPDEALAGNVRRLADLLEGVSPMEALPILVMLPLLPFMVALLICMVVYLSGALYRDRRDASVLFWQSMPVSNLKTVLSKAVTAVAVIPAFFAGAVLLAALAAAVWLRALAAGHGFETAGLGDLLLTAAAGTVLFYLSMVVGTLWLMPMVGWLLLFSAFSRRLPLLWAAGAYLLIGIAEDIALGTQYLANWTSSRAAPDGYLLLSFSGIAEALFRYDMLIGVALGGILLGGAALMRRIAD